MPPRPFRIVQEHPRLRVDSGRMMDVLQRAASGEGVVVRRVNVVLMGHEKHLQLNKRFLQHDYVTDVLSFDLRENPAEELIVGEVYVDVETASERCREFGTDFQTEVMRYAVHGFLHLVGYDDATPDEKQHMHVLEDRYLSDV